MRTREQLTGQGMIRSPLTTRSLLIAVIILAFAGDGSVQTSASQGAATNGRFGFAGKLPEIHERIDLVAAYGFRWMTPSNDMKMDVIGGCDGVYNFAPADELLAVAEDLELRVHGHTLVWHRQTSWCAERYSKADFRTYVRAVTAHYCGKVESMDVVNEALGHASGFRGADESVWYRLFGGTGYIETAFRWARHACPEMKLYYNDYGIEYGPKAEEMLALVAGLRDKGLIDGVGFQTHLTMDSFNFDRFGQTLDAVAAMGLEVALSEVDIRFKRNYWELTDADLLSQAERYRQVSELCAEREACARFTVWGLDDGHSWTNHGAFQDAALLFDRELQPKPAYCQGLRPVFDLPRGACVVE
jgi:endo-1,4-beta-xylanase